MAGQRAGRGRGRGRGDANQSNSRGGRGGSRGGGSFPPLPRPRGSPATARGGRGADRDRGGAARNGAPARGAGRRSVAITLVDDSMDPDDGYDDIGEYDDEVVAASAVPLARPHPSAPLPVAVALASHAVVRASTVAAKKGRGGWDEVDVGELTVMEMDRRMEEEQRQMEAQRLATERARQWTQRGMLDRVMGMKAKEAEQRLLQQASQYNARMAQQHVGLGRHPGAGFAAGKKGGTAKSIVGAGAGRKAGELLVSLAHPHHAVQRSVAAQLISSLCCPRVLRSGRKSCC